MRSRQRSSGMTVTSGPHRVRGSLASAREAIVLLVLVIAGSVLAQMYVASQTYHPVVKLTSPDGLTFNVVQDAPGPRDSCGNANYRFLDPIKKHCSRCKVLYARCERELDGLEYALSTGEPLPEYLVVGAGLHIAVRGPPDKVKQACEQIASDMVHGGLQAAACVYPRPKAKTGST